MSACTKREVGIVATLKVQNVWLPELARIAIGGPEHKNNLLALACLDATELEVLQDHTARVLNWAFVAQQFLDSGPDEFRVFAKLGGLLGMTKQRIQTVPDEIAGGFVPPKEQHDA